MSPQMVHQQLSPTQVIRENPQQVSQQQFQNQIPQQNQKVSSPPLPTLQETPENNETYEEIAHPASQLQHRSPPANQQLANNHLQKAQPNPDIRDQPQQRSPLGYESLRAREVANETKNHPIENLLPERNLNDKDERSLLQRAQFEAFEKQNESLDLDERFDLERRQIREQKPLIDESYDRHIERRMFEERENDMKRLADPNEQDVEELLAQTRNGNFKGKFNFF